MKKGSFRQRDKDVVKTKVQNLCKVDYLGQIQKVMRKSMRGEPGMKSLWRTWGTRSARCWSAKEGGGGETTK